jgi:acyl-CoA dehydrogenase
MPDGEGADAALRLVLDQVRRFGRTLDSATMDREATIPPEVLSQAAHLGLFGLTIPEGHGGLGLHLGAACQVVSELATFDRSVATTVGLHCGLGVRGLVEMGTPAQQDRWLPVLARGELIASFCATESGAGSDLTSVRTRARREGERLILDGEKAYVTNGAWAGLYVVLASTPGMGGARAWSLLCVPRGTPGLHVGAEEHKLGIRASSTTSVRFDGARLPLDCVLGAPGEGMAHANRLLAWGRTLMSAGCVGTARAALAQTLAHVSTRRQFGRSLIAFEPVRMHVATMGSLLWAMEALLDHAAACEVRGQGIPMASAAAKVFCSEGVFDICDRALQLHGAMGFVEDTGVARMMRDCRVTRIFEGANDVLLGHIATGVVATAPGTHRRLHRCGEGTGWDEGDARLRAAMDSMRRRKGLALVREQCLLRAFGEAHVLLLAASAALARGEAAGAEGAVRASHAARLLVTRARHALDGLTGMATQVVQDKDVVELLMGPQGAPPTESRRREPGDGSSALKVQGSHP